MQTTMPEWQHLAIYAVGAALIVMLLQRIPFVGRILRFAISLGLMAFLIFILLSEAPYQPELSRFADRLGLDDQQVAGGELRVPMASDGHFWVLASINGVRARMLIDSGATITALSRPTARAAKVGTGTGLWPIVLHTAKGAAPADTGDRLRYGPRLRPPRPQQEQGRHECAGEQVESAIGQIETGQTMCAIGLAVDPLHVGDRRAHRGGQDRELRRCQRIILADAGENQ